MTKPFFTVDKNRSLEIIREIAALVGSEEEKNCVMRSQDYEEVNDGEYTLLSQNHKLAVVELELEIALSPEPRKDPDVSCYAREFYEAVEQDNYNRSQEIEIYSGSVVDGDKIALKAYLHETQADCDVSYPTFTYDEQYECWIVRENFWGVKNGINCNLVTILDFSDYDLTCSST